MEEGIVRYVFDWQDQRAVFDVDTRARELEVQKEGAGVDAFEQPSVRLLSAQGECVCLLPGGDTHPPFDGGIS